MKNILNTIITAAVGSAAIAAGALTLSAPASAAASIQQACEQTPGLYASGAVKGVYSTAKRGWDRDQICKVYDANGKLLGTTTVTDYYFYRAAVIPGQTPARSAS